MDLTPHEKALRAPLLPGVYIMKDSSGAVIYVGKAKVLRNRLLSYFRGAHNAKTEAMVAKIADFDVIVVHSEFEALVLENSLIKHHMPKYNILLKDDKGYPFIRLDTKAEYPTFSVVSAAADDGASYFGPYGGRGSTFAAIDAVCKALKLPTCGKKFPRDIGKQRPCLNYHMGLCSGWCRVQMQREDYLALIRQAEMILSGRTDSLVRQLTSQMEAAAEAMRFEQAAEIRDRIAAIGMLKTRQLAWSAGMMSDTDVFGYCRQLEKCCFVVLHYEQGKLLGKEFQISDEPVEQDEQALSGYIRQFYLSHGSVPKTVLSSLELPDREALEQLLSQTAGKSVTIHTPQRGDKSKLTMNADVNAREELNRATTAQERTTKTVRSFGQMLGLEKPPVRIEAFDISNTQGEGNVASMTVFVSGRPLKRDYRKFRIKTVEGQDDYASMSEAVSRRFERYAAGDEKFAPLPDVLLIDGGEEHARAAVRAMQAAGCNVPVFGMVKDDRHRTRALMTPQGREISLQANPAVFALVGSIQEETHRFAIEYHKKLRSGKLRASALDGIPGVGEKRKSQLLKHFGSIRAVKQADMEQLRMLLPANAAQAVYKHFHPDSEDTQCE